ncbi:hypothetical protein Tco_1405001 [Tanacetum coccineum]
MKKESNEEDQANDPRNLLYARTEYCNGNNDSSGGSGRGSYSRGHGRGRGQGRDQDNSQNQGQRNSSKKREENEQKVLIIKPVVKQIAFNKAHNPEEWPKEDTNEVGQESDEEANPYSSSVTVHNLVHETNPKSKEDNFGSELDMSSSNELDSTTEKYNLNALRQPWR